MPAGILIVLLVLTLIFYGDIVKNVRGVSETTKLEQKLHKLKLEKEIIELKKELNK